MGRGLDGGCAVGAMLSPATPRRTASTPKKLDDAFELGHLKPRKPRMRKSLGDWEPDTPRKRQRSSPCVSRQSVLFESSWPRTPDELWHWEPVMSYLTPISESQLTLLQSPLRSTIDKCDEGHRLLSSGLEKRGCHYLAAWLREDAEDMIDARDRSCVALLPAPFAAQSSCTLGDVVYGLHLVPASRHEGDARMRTSVEPADVSRARAAACEDATNSLRSMTSHDCRRQLEEAAHWPMSRSRSRSPAAKAEACMRARSGDHPSPDSIRLGAALVAHSDDAADTAPAAQRKEAHGGVVGASEKSRVNIPQSDTSRVSTERTPLASRMRTRATIARAASPSTMFLGPLAAPPAATESATVGGRAASTSANAESVGSASSFVRSVQRFTWPSSVELELTGGNGALSVVVKYSLSWRDYRSSSARRDGGAEGDARESTSGARLELEEYHADLRHAAANGGGAGGGGALAGGDDTPAESATDELGAEIQRLRGELIRSVEANKPLRDRIRERTMKDIAEQERIERLKEEQAGILDRLREIQLSKAHAARGGGGKRSSGKAAPQSPAASSSTVASVRVSRRGGAASPKVCRRGEVLCDAPASVAQYEALREVRRHAEHVQRLAHLCRQREREKRAAIDLRFGRLQAKMEAEAKAEDAARSPATNAGAAAAECAVAAEAAEVPADGNATCAEEVVR